MQYITTTNLNVITERIPLQEKQIQVILQLLERVVKDSATEGEGIKIFPSYCYPEGIWYQEEKDHCFRYYKIQENGTLLHIMTRVIEIY